MTASGGGDNSSLGVSRWSAKGPWAAAAPWVAGTICLVILIWAARPPRATSEFAIERFAALPVSYKGRVKPIDTVARNVLMILSNRQSIRLKDEDTDEKVEVPAIVWLLDALSQRPQAEQYPVLRIDHPEVLALFGWKQTKQKLFSVAAVREHGQKLIDQAHLAGQVPAKERNLYQRKVTELATHLTIYQNLTNYADLYMVPPVAHDRDWMPMGEAMAMAEQSGAPPAGSKQWATMLFHYGEGDEGEVGDRAAAFNKTLAEYESELAFRQPSAAAKGRFETFLNRYAPFYRCMVIYVTAGVLVFLSWLGWSRPLVRAAAVLVAIGFVLHTLGLVARIYLSGRPPVTNLYSSAVFIGWAMVLLCLILERLYRNGLATLLGAMAGFLTLIVAWALQGDGDTMAVLVAVLDTNFWLATHVVAITIGYSATFLAGLIGIVYIFRGLLTRSLTQQEHRRTGQMLYGTICFAVFFSFVGTILGGIWADQSWGRFWGWDPKENGALLIVLWNALILHARWSGMAQQRGMAVLAVFGNIVTSWSWFGTNMLGVGLHSYGFIDSAVFWLMLFVFSQLVVMAFGCLPLRYWRSFRALAMQPTGADPVKRPVTDGSPGGETPAAPQATG